MAQKTALLWFRQDLRLRDNPALHHALEQNYQIIPVYILDDENAGTWKMGGASRWWLHQSLKTLNQSLNSALVFRVGPAEKIIPQLIKETGAKAVFWNRCYEPWRIARDKIIKEHLQDNDIVAESFNASLLWEPWHIKKNDGTPYKVFTPYYRKGCLGHSQPAAPKPAPVTITYAVHPDESQDLILKSTKSRIKSGTHDIYDALMQSIAWYKTMEKTWTPGEDGAKIRLQDFLQNGLKGYKDGRNHPDRENVSRLSPHLHFGEISPREVWHAVQAKAVQDHAESDADCYCSELGWREFSTYLLYHCPEITWQNLQKKFDTFPWKMKEDKNLRRWQRGQTGIPIVDAGMRQLWQEGWMHNRVRMITASLLVKNMLTHWRLGEQWFWDTLVDADLASNAASWQWVAGSGADAAPYFRIFNPVLQGEKFDPQGAYVRKYIPELKNVPDQYVHRPWDMGTPPANYPSPIIDLKISRDRALEALQSTKG